ncbi:MAG: Crp/Fnr family transcriptional regulator [Treponema sp.]|nr:Crp/Fnr family transcriptional regulator [Candidatus Treponema equi]
MDFIMENMDVLHNSFLFKGMKDRQIESALRKLGATEKKYRKNSYLVVSGQKEMNLGLMLEGSAIASQDDIWGNRYEINMISGGESFAEPYAASDMPSGINIQAKETCRVLWLNISKINFAGNDPILLMVASNLLQTMALKLLASHERMSHISKQTTKDKIMSYLSSQSQKNNSMDFVIPFDRQQLADYLAVERSAMSAELSKLRKEGRIKTRKSHFTIYP